MTLKLSELLFEEQDSKKIHKLLKEAEDENKSEESAEGEGEEDSQGSQTPVDIDDVRELSNSAINTLEKQMAD